MKKILSRNSELLKLTWPIFLEIFLFVLISNIDQVMIASDPIAVKAITEAGSIMNVLTNAFAIIALASTILITNYRGANDKESVKKVYSVSFYFNLIIGLIISAVLFFFADPLLNLIQVPDTIMESAKIYLQINGGLIFLQSLSQVFGTFLRSNKFMIQSTIVSISINLLNILGNALALYVFDAGILGIAISSVFSRLVGLIALIFLYNHYIHESLSPFKAWKSKKILGLMMKIGLPSAGEQFSYSFSQFVIMIFINKLPEFNITVKTYASMLAGCAYMFSSALSQASQILLGSFTGSKNYPEAKRLVSDTTKLSIVISVAISVFLAIIAYPVFYLLVSENRTGGAELGLIIMIIDVVLEFGRGTNIIMVRSLQTAGDIIFPTSMSVIFCWVVAVFLGFILSTVCGLGLIGVWLAMMIDEVSRGFIFWGRWRSSVWEKKRLIKD